MDRDLRQFTHFADDDAIFIDDTLDKALVRQLDVSPSAAVILSPQQSHSREDQIITSSAQKQRRRTFGTDLSNGPVRLSFSSVQNTPSGAKEKQYVAHEEYTKLEKEAIQLEAMYDHSRAQYEALQQLQCDTNDKLQVKIMEVIALSSRNEESKRFIRQMKKEMLQCKERSLDLHNRAFDDSRMERDMRQKYENMMQFREEQHLSTESALTEEIASLHALVNDLGRSDKLGKSVMSLLKASYLKNAQQVAELLQARRDRQREHERRMEA